MMEKTMNLRNDRGFIKKDATAGYTTSLTHPSEYTPYVKRMESPDPTKKDTKTETQKLLDALGIDIDLSE